MSEQLAGVRSVRASKGKYSQSCRTINYMRQLYKNIACHLRCVVSDALDSMHVYCMQSVKLLTYNIYVAYIYAYNIYIACTYL